VLSAVQCVACACCCLRWRPHAAQAMLLVDRLGRCKLQLLLFICTGATFLSLMGSSFADATSCPSGGNIFPVFLSVFLLFVGRGASNACFSATYVATPELYVPSPATQRPLRACPCRLPRHTLLPNLICRLTQRGLGTQPTCAQPRSACAAACPESRELFVPMPLEQLALQTSS